MSTTPPRTSWEQLSNLLEDYGPTAVIVIGLLVTFWLIVKLWPLLRATFRIADVLVALPEKLPALEATISEIRKEVKPNGGSSMRDVINETGKRVANLEKRFDEHLGDRPAQTKQRPSSSS